MIQSFELWLRCLNQHLDPEQRGSCLTELSYFQRLKEGLAISQPQWSETRAQIREKKAQGKPLMPGRVRKVRVAPAVVRGVAQVVPMVVMMMGSTPLTARGIVTLVIVTLAVVIAGTYGQTGSHTAATGEAVVE